MGLLTIIANPRERLYTLGRGGNPRRYCGLSINTLRNNIYYTDRLTELPLWALSVDSIGIEIESVALRFVYPGIVRQMRERPAQREPA